MSEVILMMTTRKNRPLPLKPTWKETICMECGQECWDNPVLDKLQEKLRDAKKMCEDCALKAYVARREAAGER